MAMYVVWALLPITLFGMGLWAVFRKRFQDKKKDHPIFYTQQGLFCLVVLILTIGLDQTLFNALFLADDPVFYIDDQLLVRIVNWMLYPVLLLSAALVQSRFFDK